ncbi:MAG TPA: sigma-70 family RNA polymerase sigma factor [Polyangiaceae bacterium]|nr:sigma-70 family RNA polymerase sigma factor [Polyangiaceae bacterium]
MGAAHDNPDTLSRFNDNLDLVDILAKQVARSVGRASELDDLIAYGREGLLDAARRFDASRGVPFRAYANYRVRGAIIDGVRAMARLPRRIHERLGGLQAAVHYGQGVFEDVLSAPTTPGAGVAQAEQALADHMAAMATAIAVGFVAEAARGEEGELTSVAPELDPERALGQAELLHLVRGAISDLPAEEAELVRRHYLEGERFDKVAAELGLSKSWASRLHSRAIARLSKRLRGSG